MVCCYVPGLRRTRNPTHLTNEDHKKSKSGTQRAFSIAKIAGMGMMVTGIIIIAIESRNTVHTPAGYAGAALAAVGTVMAGISFMLGAARGQDNQDRNPVTDTREGE